MKIIALVAAVLAAAALLIAPSAAPGNVGFNATDISGFPTGAASLTGGGAYNPRRASRSQLVAFDAPAMSSRAR
jgi:hypothetical protein